MAVTPSSVSALLKPKANLGRNAFPLDHKQVFSIKAGQITPVKCMHFMPNDYFDLQASEFCISFPMNTAPFLRGRKETAFYSVYYNAVWSLYNQYQGQRSDPKTSAFLDNRFREEPRIAKFELYKQALFMFIGFCFCEYYIPAETRHNHSTYSESELLAASQRAVRNWLASSSFNPTMDFRIGTAPFGLASYPPGANYSWTMINSRISGAQTATGAEVFQDVVGQWRVYNYLRKLDMLGYGNLNPWFKEVESHIIEKRESVTDWSDDTQFQGFITACNDAFYLLAQRIQTITSTYQNADAQGFPTAQSEPIFEMVNLYPLCSYNLIFYHFFRNSFYDLNYYPHDFNLDFVSVDSSRQDNEVYQSDFSLRFLDIEYHQWKKDTFTSVLPDTQFGAVASIDINSSGSINVSGSATLNGSTGSDVGNWVTFDGSSFPHAAQVTTHVSSSNLSASGTGPINHTHPINGTATISSSGTASMYGGFDVIALKRAEMLQDYRQTLMRAGNKTSDIFKALYGGTPSSEHEDDVIPRFLDTFGEDVFVDPVTATASTGENDNGTLGDLASRAKFSAQSGHIKFNAGYNFGCILMLTYFVPTAEYNSYLLDKHVCELSPEDHYISNFENFGLEPVYSNELNDFIPNNNVQVRGFAPRYHHKKSQIDMVHGEFVSLPSSLKVFRTYQSGGVFPRGRNTLLTGYFGDFNVWVSPRTDMQSRANTQLRDFYVNPSVLDNIFKFACDARQSSDQLLCNVYINWQSTRAMSKVGLINFV